MTTNFSVLFSSYAIYLSELFLSFFEIDLHWACLLVREGVAFRLGQIFSIVSRDFETFVQFPMMGSCDFYMLELDMFNWAFSHSDVLAFSADVISSNLLVKFVNVSDRLLTGMFLI